MRWLRPYKRMPYFAPGVVGNAGVPLPEINGGRLTLVTGTPVPTSDQDNASNLYWEQYAGNYVALYNGSSWVYHTIGSGASVDTTGLSVDTNYDVFVYDNAGTLTLDLTAWTNDTTRATALTTQDGVYVKTGALTRRYVGTIRTVDNASSPAFQDSEALRFVWNYYNRVRRSLRVHDATDSWSYSTASYRQSNGSTANQVAVVVGVQEDMLDLRALGLVAAAGGTTAASGVGVNSTTVNSAQLMGGRASDASVAYQVWCHYRDIPREGYSYFAWLEYQGSTWYGDAGSPTVFQSGLIGEVRA